MLYRYTKMFDPFWMHKKREIPVYGASVSN